MDNLKLYLNKIAKAFGYEYNDSFFSYLKSISKPNNQVCNREIKSGEGGFKCIDCFFLNNAVICMDCYNKTKDKHKNHNAIFKPYSSGFCDCGDPNTMNKESFCHDHQGPFTNEKDLMNYIKTCLDEKKLEIINPLINNIFVEIINLIDNLYNKNSENEEKQNIEDELFNMIDELISFISKLYNNNLGLFYLVTLKFTENFPFETNHKCFKYEENEKKVIFIKENKSEKHKCICPFFQIFVNMLMTRETVHDSKSLFTLFIQNYKNNIITSLSYIHSFVELNENSNLTSLRELGYQLLSPQLCELIYDEKNINFTESFFTEVYEKTKKLIELNKYDEVDLIFYNLLWLIIYLPNLKTIDKIISQIKIHGIIIDIICLINNLNVFGNKIKFTIFQRNGFLSKLLHCEIYTIQISVLLCYLIDFDNLESVKYIFNKIISKIREYKNYKENLLDKTFSPHITIIKYFSIFLNRFCFNYSLNNNCDLLDSFQYFQNLFPEIKDLNLFMFEELIIFFGFIISQKYNFFSYFGENMELYYINYFKSNLDIILPDITLMKYLLTLPEIQSVFNIDQINKILIYSNIENSNDFFINLKPEILKEKNEELNNEINNNVRNFNYINSILEFLIIIIRDNISMIKLAFKFSDLFKMNYKDKLFEKLLIKEKDNFENLIKSEIIHYIVGNKNIVKREDCLKVYEYYDHEDINKNLINDLLKMNCDEITFSNQLKRYTLKKSIFQFFDIDYLFDYAERTNALKYTIEFQSNNYNILNTYIINPLSIQDKLNSQIYGTFFNNKHIDNFINFYKILITNNNYPQLTDIFFFTLSKIICLYIKLYNNDIEEESKKNLIEIIENNKLEKNNDSSIQYIKKLLSNEDIKDKNHENKSSNLKKSLKEKYKKKFDEKNKIITEKYSNSDIQLELENDNSSNVEEICVYCRQPITNDLNNYYGRICYLVCDYFIDILKKKEEKMRKKSTRFVTCNHNIHFDCLNKFIIKYNINVLKDGYICPLCKKLSNTMICDLSSLFKSNQKILKGLNLDNYEKDNFFKEYNDKDFIDYQNLILQNKNFFEDYCTKLLKREILAKDINDNINIFEEIYNLILNDFETFCIYYNITTYKKEQIDIWKNILLTIRLLCKYQIINVADFFISKFKLIYKSLQEINFIYLNNFEISSIINEFIICLFILYDLNEENKNKIKNLFYNNILIYMIIYEFLKNKDNCIEDFFDQNKNKDLLKKIFNIYNLKYKIFSLFYDEKVENLQLDSNINIIKNNPKVITLINNYKNLILKEQCLEIPKFELINLPENFIEFCAKYMNIDCIYCHKKQLDYYICLICGNKICDQVNCLSEVKPNGKKEYSLIDHSKKCGGGNVIFISGKDSQIIYLLKRQFSNSGIYIYLNSFGEYAKGYDLNNNYILNRIELEKAIQIFIDMTYRKKGNRIISL